jgi:hypothetical protein
MTHLPFIAVAYALGILVPVAYAVAAYARMGAAKRKLAVIDPRAARDGG